MTARTKQSRGGPHVAPDFERLRELKSAGYPMIGQDDVARVLGVSEYTVQRWRVQGVGPRFAKLGPGKRARVAYRLEDLLAYIDRNLVRTTGSYR